MELEVLKQNVTIGDQLRKLHESKASIHFESIIARLETQNKQLSEQLASRTVLFEAHRKSLQMECTRQTSLLTEHEKENFNLRGRLQQLEHSFSELLSEKQQLYQHHKNQESEYSGCKQELLSAIEKCEELETTNSDQHNKIMEMQNTIEMLQTSDIQQIQDRAYADLNRMKREHDQAEQIFNAKMSELRLRVESLTVARDVAVEEKSRLQSELNSKNDLMVQLVQHYQVDGHRANLPNNLQTDANTISVEASEGLTGKSVLIGSNGYDVPSVPEGFRKCHEVIRASDTSQSTCVSDVQSFASASSCGDTGEKQTGSRINESLDTNSSGYQIPVNITDAYLSGILGIEDSVVEGATVPSINSSEPDVSRCGNEALEVNRSGKMNGDDSIVNIDSNFSVCNGEEKPKYTQRETKLIALILKLNRRYNKLVNRYVRMCESSNDSQRSVPDADTGTVETGNETKVSVSVVNEMLAKARSDHSTMIAELEQNYQLRIDEYKIQLECTEQLNEQLKQHIESFDYDKLKRADVEAVWERLKRELDLEHEVKVRYCLCSTK